MQIVDSLTLRMLERQWKNISGTQVNRRLGGPENWSGYSREDKTSYTVRYL
jgi:hypothetical protein